MENTKEIMIVNQADVENLIYTIRGQKVMLDSYLAKIYGYETKRLNEQVRRNKHKFPDDFMFQLTNIVFDNLKSQNATAKIPTNRIYELSRNKRYPTGFFVLCVVYLTNIKLIT